MEKYNKDEIDKNYFILNNYINDGTEWLKCGINLKKYF